jgi:hypothetical protein
MRFLLNALPVMLFVVGLLMVAEFLVSQCYLLIFNYWGKTFLSLLANLSEGRKEQKERCLAVTICSIFLGNFWNSEVGMR